MSVPTSPTEVPEPILNSGSGLPGRGSAAPCLPGSIEDKIAVDDSTERNILADYPLVMASTPTFLRRFNYQHYGQTYAFDEDQLPRDLVQLDHRCARLLRRLEGSRTVKTRSGSFSKRRPEDVDLPVPAAKRKIRSSSSDDGIDVDSQTAAAAAAAAAVMAQSQNNSISGPRPPPPPAPQTVESLLYIDPVVTPSDCEMPPPQVAVPGPSPLPQSPVAPTSGASAVAAAAAVSASAAGAGSAAAAGETSLLSPTASPKIELIEDDLPGPLDSMDTTTTPVASNPLGSAMGMHASEKMDADVADNIARIIDGFEQLPPNTHRYVLYSLMRSCNRSSLSSLVAILDSALRCDLLSKLPRELSSIVLSYLDAASLCSATQVCRAWYNLVESNEVIWKNLLDRDQLTPTETDLKRAHAEGWGYSGWTRDLSDPQCSHQPPTTIHRPTPALRSRSRLSRRSTFEPALGVRELPAFAEVSGASNPPGTATTGFGTLDTRSNTNTTGTGVAPIAGPAGPTGLGSGTRTSASTNANASASAAGTGTGTGAGTGAGASNVRLASPFGGAPKSPLDSMATPATQNRTATVNALGRPINIYKAIYRRKLLISRNWMSPKSRPRHFSIPCAARDTITCLEFDEDRIISGSDSRSINVYNTRTGELLHNFNDHEGGVWALKYINKDILVSGSVDRTVRVWSISKAKCTHVFRGHTSTVRCLDVVMPVPRVDPATGITTYVPPRPVIVTGSRDATLRMWWLPAADDPEYHAHDNAVDDAENPFFIRALSGHQNPVRAINGYEDTVVSGSYDNTVRVWRISDGKCRHELVGHQQKVYSALIDHKRNRCISASMDWSVKVWCIETGSLLYTLEGHTSLVGLLDLSKTMLVSAAADSTLRVWDPETGKLLHRLSGHQRAITCFQHDETKVISGSEQTLKLWNIKTGKLVCDLFNGTDLAAIWQVGFDSRRCVSAVNRDNSSFLEVLDFDYDPNEPESESDMLDIVGQT